MSLAAFESIVGGDFVRQTPGREVDGVPVVGEVSPGSPEQVAACLAVAAREGHALVPRGGGTKLGIGNRPEARDLVSLSLGRLSALLEVEADEGIGTASAGVPLERLRSEARSRGKRTLFETPHAGATVGGTVAAAAHGAGLHPDRRPRDDLLGLTVALPNGTLARAGGRVVKNVTGYDLVRLHFGAHGTLGVITEVTFRLRPMSEARRVGVRELPSLGEAIAAAGTLIGSGAGPDGTAVLPTDGGALLVWILEGTARDVEARAARFEGDAAGDDRWEAVERALLMPPPSGASRVRLLGRSSDTARLALHLASVGGSLTVALPSAGIALGDLADASLVEGVGRVRSSGISVVVEDASPDLKARIEVFGPAPDLLPVMRSLKSRFDPQRVLAPGRFAGRI